MIRDCCIQCKFIHLIKMMLNYYESWNKRQQKTKKIFNTFSHRSWFLCLNFIDFDLTLIHLSPLLIFSFSLAKPKGRNEMKKSKYPNSHDNDDYQIESNRKSNQFSIFFSRIIVYSWLELWIIIVVGCVVIGQW